MKKLDPKFRIRWKTALPSAAFCQLSVAKASCVAGTQQTPVPSPCTPLVQATSQGVRLMSKVVIQSPAAPCSPKPTAIQMRGSILDSQIMAMKPISVPIPREASNQPMVVSGSHAIAAAWAGKSP